MSWIQSQIKLKDGGWSYHPHSLLYSYSFSSPPLPYNSDYQKQPNPPSSSPSGSKISPVVLFIIVILAVIFFISGLLHLLVRFLMKRRSPLSISESDRYPEMSGSDAFQRQLQQLFHLHDSGEENGLSSNGGSVLSLGPKPAENDIGKRVFSVRLGKFRSSSDGRGGEGEEGEGEGVLRGEGETSSCNLDARRCYSMGSYQYVVADELQVALCPCRGGNGSASVKLLKGIVGQNGNSSNDGDVEEKKINLRSKGESFSVSKIWQWSKKGKFISSSDAIGSSSVTVGLPWME